MTVQLRLFATPDYLNANGTPVELSDISDHRLIFQNVHSPQVGASALMVQNLMTYHIRSLLTVNNYYGVLQGVIHNLGIGILPDYVTQDFPNLVSVLPDVTTADVPVFLAYPEELRQSKRVAAFRDFVQDEIISYRRKLRDQTKS
jgi:DNA-binding transcriptional LysR family regulator